MVSHRVYAYHEHSAPVVDSNRRHYLRSLWNNDFANHFAGFRGDRSGKRENVVPGSHTLDAWYHMMVPQSFLVEEPLNESHDQETARNIMHLM